LRSNTTVKQQASREKCTFLLNILLPSAPQLVVGHKLTSKERFQKWNITISDCLLQNQIRYIDGRHTHLGNQIQRRKKVKEEEGSQDDDPQLEGQVNTIF